MFSENGKPVTDRHLTKHPRLEDKQESWSLPLFLVREKDPMENLSTYRIGEVKGFDYYLRPEAQKIYNTKRYTTVEEYSIKGEERKYTVCQYFSKPVFLDKDGDVPIKAILSTAAAFNMLVTHSLIDFGVLSPLLKMAMLPREDGRERALLIMHLFASDNCYRRLENDKTLRKELNLEENSDVHVACTKFLNVFLKDECFAFEGQVGSCDWSNFEGIWSYLPFELYVAVKHMVE